MQPSLAELLARLQPVLEEIFDAYQISEEQARRIVEETGTLLLMKGWEREHPGRWLLRTIVERCRETALAGTGDLPGDPPS
ncbi:MAG TPA: hypothetical protein VLE27_16150 [Thermoanaerobaculia bacterium]|nr:hypothetical protein [Thermoanaerobaculia bacterium]